MPETATKSEGPKKTVKATISPHRTLVVNGEHRAAGSEVEVSEEEYPKLIAQGFLVNPDEPAPVLATGPKIQKTGT